jgi:multiple sugar transport system substrate-binding protein
MMASVVGVESATATFQRALPVSRRRVIQMAVMAIPGTVMLASCGGQAAQGQPAKPAALKTDVTLQLLIDLGAADQPLFEKVVARWRTTHPQGPKVEWTAGTNVADVLTKTQAGMAAGSAPDLIQQEATGAVSLSGKGQLHPIDPFIKRDKYDLSDFFERSHPQFDWKGKKYGLSKGMSNQSLYVNQTLFDQAGVAYPPNKANATGWDFDAFLKAADRLTKRSGDTTTQWGFVVGRGLRGGWLQWVRTNGGEVFDKDFTRCLLGEAKAIEGLQFMQDLMYKFRVAPTPKEEMAAGGDAALFINQGITGMRISPVSSTAPHRRATFQWDHAVNPQGKGKRVTTGGGQAWLITSTTKAPDEAWALLQHVASVESSREMATIWYPARKSTLAELIAQEPGLPPKSRNVGPEGQDLTELDPIFPAYSDIQRDIIVPELNALWENQKTASQVAESLVPKVNAALKA